MYDDELVFSCKELCRFTRKHVFTFDGVSEAVDKFVRARRSEGSLPMILNVGGSQS